MFISVLFIVLSPHIAIETNQVWLAQSVEHGTFNLMVLGSSPALGVITFCVKYLRAIRILHGLQLSRNQIKSDFEMPEK